MSYRRPAPRTTLFVVGFPPQMRARDLAYEFERMGPLVRCDIPAVRSANASPYAFIEYEDPRDAEASHRDMHGMRLGRYTLSIQFAKNAPSANWRFDGPAAPRDGPGRDGPGRDGPSRDRRGPPPPPPRQRQQLSKEEQEEADRAAEERALARSANRARSPDRRRDDDDYPESRRSSSRRIDDERDRDDDRRRRYDDDDEDRYRDRDREPERDHDDNNTDRDNGRDIDNDRDDDRSRERSKERDDVEINQKESSTDLLPETNGHEDDHKVNNERDHDERAKDADEQDRDADSRSNGKHRVPSGWSESPPPR